MQCSTQLVFHITRVHQWPVFYLMPVRLPGLSCRAQLVPMHGIIPSLLQDCSFVLVQFHEVPDYGSLSEQQLGPPIWENCKCRLIKMGKKKKKKKIDFFCKFIFISLLRHSLSVLCQIPPALGFVSKQAMWSPFLPEQELMHAFYERW